MRYLATVQVQQKINQFPHMVRIPSRKGNRHMFSECEHSCLVRLAQDCKRRGMTHNEAQRQIENDFGGFSTSFRIAQAVQHAFCVTPDLVVRV
jgi:hypothetical protein